jgi:hypothetical protein
MTRSTKHPEKRRVSGIDVDKVFQDLGISPIEQSPWPVSPIPNQWLDDKSIVYKVTSSNGTGRVVRFNAELE